MVTPLCRCQLNEVAGLEQDLSLSCHRLGRWERGNHHEVGSLRTLQLESLRLRRQAGLSAALIRVDLRHLDMAYRRATS